MKLLKVDKKGLDLVKFQDCTTRPTGSENNGVTLSQILIVLNGSKVFHDTMKLSGIHRKPKRCQGV